MENSTLIKIGVVVVIIFILWMAYVIVRDLKGGSLGIDGGDILEFFKK